MTKTEKLVKEITNSLDYNKGEDIIKIDLRKADNAFCDFFVICHGNSNTHVTSLVEYVEEDVRKALGEKPFHIEGTEEAEWIILDYSNVLVHVFQKDRREFYQLEDFWANGKIIRVRQKK